MIWAEHGSPLCHSLTDWVSMRVFGEPRSFGPAVCMAVLHGETIIAVMVFHNFDRGAGVIELSGAADSSRWISRPVLREMFGYAFDQLGCQQVVMRIDPDNGAGPRGLQRLARAYGFQPTVLPRMRGRGKDDVLWRLTDDDWRANGFN